MTDHDDAQRTLEQRALRNVRALVEKLEAQDGKATTARTVIGVIAVVVVASIAVIAWLLIVRPSATKEIVEATPPGPESRTAQDLAAESERKYAILAAQRGALGRPETAEEAKLWEEIERTRDAIRARPRKTFVGAQEQPRFATYVAQVMARIEDANNRNYPAEIHGINGTLQMTIGILPDGKLESIEINRKAADPRLDAAAVRSVRLAAPFAPFPDEIRETTDILYVTRTFNFRSSGT